MPYTQQELDDQILQAEKAFSDKAYDEAVAILDTITQKNPDYAPAYRKLAAIYLRTKTPETALPLINKTLELAPDDSQNWIILGHYYVGQKMWADALNAFNKALKLAEKNKPQIQYEIFKVYRSSNNTDNALELIAFLSRTYPDVLVYAWDYAKMLKQARQNSKALEVYKRLISRPLEQVPAVLLVEWQQLMTEEGHAGDALSWLQKQNGKYPGAVIFKWMSGSICMEIGDYDKSVKLLKEAYKLDPDFLPNVYSLAFVFYTRGEKKEALFYLNQYFTKQTSVNAEALHLATMLQKVEYGSKLHKQLDRASELLQTMLPEDQVKLHYALGKANDDMGDYKTAFIHYRKGGEIHALGYPDPLQELSELKDICMENFDKSTLTSMANKGYHDKSPVFIVGTPRSGTTLMEKVISSLDESIYAAGELSYLSSALHSFIMGNHKLNAMDNQLMSDIDETWSLEERGKYYTERTRALAPKGTRRIIDKMPDNFRFVGPLKLILPDAAIIHARRHPAEICLSAYRLSFEKGLTWSDDLKKLGQYYRLHHEMMEYWKSILPEGSILEVRYEDMVNDLENQSKRIAEHIDMEWDPKCLEFHQNRKTVKTASTFQVNQPLYKSSMNRWKKYEPYLQPLLDEIGDLIEAYETELEKDR